MRASDWADHAVYDAEGRLMRYQAPEGHRERAERHRAAILGGQNMLLYGAIRRVQVRMEELGTGWAVQ